MRVGILGTGLMGGPMAMRLQQSGHRVKAWNRSADNLAPLAQVGIETAPTAAAVLTSCEVTITMLSDAAAIESVVLAEPAALQQRTILQMGTIAPNESRELCEKVQAAGGEYLESPVLGSIPQVKAGELILMVGATAAQYERWLPLLKCFGAEPQWVGPVGAAAATKLAMNQLIGTLTAAFSMSLGLVQREGLDVEQFMAIVRESALYAPTFDKKLERMRDRNFSNPNFPTKHLLKDMNLFVQAAQAQGMETDVAEGVCAIARKAISQGLAEVDYSAIYNAINLEN
ncbi:MAG: 3-hydroxyisobutyrate dehydrogenase MmsB [Phormidesmis priestleyi Ana]|uniref:3-hydroxyisobutyrate dehydrogenase MmsB n=1 Tax=Phormidesmis priestleyi Ana TaxID=1666911 RepID=A0A0N8KN67_9CYAN|nr:MAG: 3-hydroxyisobutyrate dehydrogenase MmsB [Phormidesmis priestleyi Ana]